MKPLNLPRRGSREPKPRPRRAVTQEPLTPEVEAAMEAAGIRRRLDRIARSNQPTQDR